MRSEFRGKIAGVRAIEDAIRATHKYTEGLSTMKAHPVQGEAFPSKVFSKHYEVYPDVVVDWDMSVSQAAAWLWGDTTIVRVNFWYNYRDGIASMRISILAPGAENHLNAEQTNRAVREELRKLFTAIPNLYTMLLPLVSNDEDRNELQKLKEGVDRVNRNGWFMPSEGADDTEEAVSGGNKEAKRGLLDKLIPPKKKAS